MRFYGLKQSIEVENVPSFGFVLSCYGRFFVFVYVTTIKTFSLSIPTNRGFFPEKRFFGQCIISTQNSLKQESKKQPIFIHDYLFVCLFVCFSRLPGEDVTQLGASNRVLEQRRNSLSRKTLHQQVNIGTRPGHPWEMGRHGVGMTRFA